MRLPVMGEQMQAACPNSWFIFKGVSGVTDSRRQIVPGRRCRYPAPSRQLRKKAPPEGRGGAGGRWPGPLTLEGRVTTSAAVAGNILRRRVDHKRSIGSAAMQNRGARNPAKNGKKKRLQPKLEPDDRAEAKSQVMARAQGRRICARPVNLGRGRRIRLRFGCRQGGSEGGGNGAALQRQGEYRF